MIDCLAAPMAGDSCRAEPFAEQYREPLKAACAENRDIWQIYANDFGPDGFDASINRYVQNPLNRTFVLFDGDELAGMSSFIGIDETRAVLEIGGTYYRPHLRGTGFNSRVKDMMLRRAYGCGIRRVEFRVDARNARSQAAMAKLGATREGVLRADRITWTGHVRDTVLFSILRDDFLHGDAGGGDLQGFAHRLADRARLETLRHAAGTVLAENKGGASFDPVTKADRDAELAMRALIERHYPDHGIAGEEFEAKVAANGWNWVLDPIDGTRSYICGLPTWTTLIALLERGDPVLGLIDAPALGERYWASGDRSWMTAGGAAVPLRASGCTRLAGARLATTDPFLFDGRSAEAFSRVQASAATMRCGHDAYAYARLAAGSIDLVIECGLKPHDHAALIPIVRGAGGVIGDWSGGNDFAPGDVIAAATVELYEAAVAIMRDAYETGAP